MAFNHLIDFNEIPLEDWWEIYRIATDIMAAPYRYSDSCKSMVLATVFFEPSTRTQFSFQAAMLRLGGSVIGFSDPDKSSVSKGENLKDTIVTVSNYVDAIVMRHPLEGASLAASLYSRCPVINAGDGGHLHPTQTLTDLLTIKELKGTLSGHNIGLCGDLKNGRTVHSIIKALCKFKDNTFYLISTKALSLPEFIKNYIKASGCKFYEVSSIEECIKNVDIMYMTRIQKERFENEEEYNKQKGVFILDKTKMKKAKSDMIIMHPLPKVDEIDFRVDDDKRAVYFKQAEYGMYIRMALLYKMLKSTAKIIPKVHEMKENDLLKCINGRCITNHEKYLPPKFNSSLDCVLSCEYCDTPFDVVK